MNKETRNPGGQEHLESGAELARRYWNWRIAVIIALLTVAIFTFLATHNGSSERAFPSPTEELSPNSWGNMNDFYHTAAIEGYLRNEPVSKIKCVAISRLFENEEEYSFFSAHPPLFNRLVTWWEERDQLNTCGTIGIASLLNTVYETENYHPLMKKKAVGIITKILRRKHPTKTADQIVEMFLPKDIRRNTERRNKEMILRLAHEAI